MAKRLCTVIRYQDGKPPQGMKTTRAWRPRRLDEAMCDGRCQWPYLRILPRYPWAQRFRWDGLRPVSDRSDRAITRDNANRATRNGERYLSDPSEIRHGDSVSDATPGENRPQSVKNEPCHVNFAQKGIASAWLKKFRAGPSKFRKHYCGKPNQSWCSAGRWKRNIKLTQLKSDIDQPTPDTSVANHT